MKLFGFRQSNKFTIFSVSRNILWIFGYLQYFVAGFDSQQNPRPTVLRIIFRHSKITREYWSRGQYRVLRMAVPNHDNPRVVKEWISFVG